MFIILMLSYWFGICERIEKETKETVFRWGRICFGVDFIS